jgi:ferrochelatase
MAARSSYVDELNASARMIANKLGRPLWTLAYQSRSGKPADPWLEPDIGDVIRKLSRESLRSIVVAPIGFVCDHVEVLYDLDIEARKIAETLGINMVRVNCPNDQPTFIRMIADVIQARMRQVEDSR